MHRIRQRHVSVVIFPFHIYSTIISLVYAWLCNVLLCLAGVDTFNETHFYQEQKLLVWHVLPSDLGSSGVECALWHVWNESLRWTWGPWMICHSTKESHRRWITPASVQRVWHIEDMSPVKWNKAMTEIQLHSVPCGSGEEWDSHWGGVQQSEFGNQYNFNLIMIMIITICATKCVQMSLLETTLWD